MIVNRPKIELLTKMSTKAIERQTAPRNRCPKCRFYVWPGQLTELTDTSPKESHLDCPTKEDFLKMTRFLESSQFHLDSEFEGVSKERTVLVGGIALRLLSSDIDSCSLARNEKDMGVFDVFPLVLSPSKKLQEWREARTCNKPYTKSPLGIQKRHFASFRDVKNKHNTTFISPILCSVLSNEVEIGRLAREVQNRLVPRRW